MQSMSSQKCASPPVQLAAPLYARGGLTPATAAPGLGSPLLHLHRGPPAMSASRNAASQALQTGTPSASPCRAGQWISMACHGIARRTHGRRTVPRLCCCSAMRRAVECKRTSKKQFVCTKPPPKRCNPNPCPGGLACMAKQVCWYPMYS
jgi:hypothetical protein